MLRLAFDFIITWRETRTRPNAYILGFWATAANVVHTSIAAIRLSFLNPFIIFSSLGFITIINIWKFCSHKEEDVPMIYMYTSNHYKCYRQKITHLQVRLHLPPFLSRTPVPAADLSQ